jgi:hypothetical protein
MNSYYPPKIAELVQAPNFAAAQALLPAGDVLQSMTSLGLAPGQAAGLISWYCVNHGGTAYYYTQLPPSTGIGYNLTALSLQGIPNPVSLWAFGGDTTNLATQFVVNSAQGTTGGVNWTLLPALAFTTPSYLVVAGKPIILCACVQYPAPSSVVYGWTAACEGWLVPCPGGSNPRSVPIPMGPGGSIVPAIHLHFGS